MCSRKLRVNSKFKSVFAASPAGRREVELILFEFFGI